jgi:hypothetical protein
MKRVAVVLDKVASNRTIDDAVLMVLTLSNINHNSNMFFVGNGTPYRWRESPGSFYQSTASGPQAKNTGGRTSELLRWPTIRAHILFSAEEKAFTFVETINSTTKNRLLGYLSA